MLVLMFQRSLMTKMERWTESEGFEPQTRARSNTWPLPRPENYYEGDTAEKNGKYTSDCTGATKVELESTSDGQVPTSGAKKNSSRRNAWGNLSYADLIAQAIGSVPEKRLTLSQIYEWMVQNVPYFKNKGETNSSAGWKNSIRHNLSLHNRFKRIQNIGHGKSSWWVINPDAKPGKSTRRRAASMETSKFEKRKGKVKKKVESLRKSLLADTTSSPGSSVSVGSDGFPDSPLYSATGFQLSPDIGPRVSPNAISCTRLSPIPASASEWTSFTYFPSTCAPEQLAGNFAEGMKLLQEGSLREGYTNKETTVPEFDHCHSKMRPAASPHDISQCSLQGVQNFACVLPYPSPASLSNLQTRYHRSGHMSRTTPSTIMGQVMSALNNATTLDDLNPSIETFHGGFDCNVDEVIRHELSMEGSLDFNFPHNQMSVVEGQAAVHPGSPPPLNSYSTTFSVTGTSWVL